MIKNASLEFIIKNYKHNNNKIDKNNVFWDKNW